MATAATGALVQFSLSRADSTRFDVCMCESFGLAGRSIGWLVARSFAHSLDCMIVFALLSSYSKRIVCLVATEIKTHEKSHANALDVYLFIRYMLWRTRQTQTQHDCFRIFCSTSARAMHTSTVNSMYHFCVQRRERRICVPFKRPNEFMSMWFCCPYRTFYTAIQCTNSWFDCIFN